MSADAFVETYCPYDLSVLRPDLEPTNLTELFQQPQTSTLGATAVRHRMGLPSDEAVLHFRHAGIEYVAQAAPRRSG